MKIGFNMLLWTGHVTEAHYPLLTHLKATGYDGVEIPIFNTSDPKAYRALGSRLDDIGLSRTAVAVLPSPRCNAISHEAAHRVAAASHLRRVVDCGSELGIEFLGGPYFQPIGCFTGKRPTTTELDYAAEVHREIAPLAATAGISCAIEPLNRFEAHLLNTTQQAIEYLNRVDTPNLHILYDTFHANIEEQDPLAALETLYRSGSLGYVHISENDRGTPGRGHASLRETIRLLRNLGYDGWLTIEAFGSAVPELAAATRVWRDFFPDPTQVYQEGYSLIRETWDGRLRFAEVCGRPAN